MLRTWIIYHFWLKWADDASVQGWWVQAKYWIYGSIPKYNDGLEALAKLWINFWKNKTQKPSLYPIPTQKDLGRSGIGTFGCFSLLSTKRAFMQKWIEKLRRKSSSCSWGLEKIVWSSFKGTNTFTNSIRISNSSNGSSFGLYFFFYMVENPRNPQYIWSIDYNLLRCVTNFFSMSSFSNLLKRVVLYNLKLTFCYQSPCC